MNWEGCERKRSWPTSKYCTHIGLQGSKKTKKNFNQDGRCPDRDLNRAPPEYKTEILPPSRYTPPPSASIMFVGTTLIIHGDLRDENLIMNLTDNPAETRAPRPTPPPPKLDHPMSVVRDSFGTFPVTVHIWKPCPQSATCRGDMRISSSRGNAIPVTGREGP
jgi:hypothetical protein